MREQKLEGVAAKRADSVYEAGKRGAAWVKLPWKRGGKFLVGGLRLRDDQISVLLVGHYDQAGRFVFAGKVCHGLKHLGGGETKRALEPLKVGRCPFANLPNCKLDPFGEMVSPEEMSTFTWLKPQVAAEVGFSEWT